MRQNTTDLSPQQLLVLEQLIAGATVTEAARAAQVSRSTVHRWLRDDFGFQAALNRGRAELQQSINRTLLAIAHRATQNVANAVDEGDVAASFRVLKGIGALAGDAERFGSDDPEVLRDETEIDRASQQSDRDLRRLIART
jgi:hypothetical protein